MARTFSRLAGAVFVAIGAAGFARPGLFGLHLTRTHNVLHVATGLVALYFGFAAGGARVFCALFGVAYLALGVLGFVAPGFVATLLGHPGPVTAQMLLPDNVLHVVLGVAFLAAGLAADSRSAIPPGRQGRFAR